MNGGGGGGGGGDRGEGGQASCLVVQYTVELPQVAGSYLLVKNSYIIPLMPNYCMAAPVPLCQKVSILY